MRKLFLVPALLLGLAGCATYDSGYGDVGGQRAGGYGNQPYYGQPAYGKPDNARLYGTVIGVRSVERGAQAGGVGAVAGAVIGGLIGHQIGDGSGNTAATIGGAAIGGYVGNRIENSQQAGGWGQEIQVRLDNGQTVSIIQPGTRLYSGARVFVSGYGNSARVVISN